MAAPHLFFLPGGPGRRCPTRLLPRRHSLRLRRLRRLLRQSVEGPYKM